MCLRSEKHRQSWGGEVLSDSIFNEKTGIRVEHGLKLLLTHAVRSNTHLDLDLDRYLSRAVRS